MARQPKPWRRAGAGGAWYAQVRGVKVRLADPAATKQQAHEALARIVGQVQTTAATEITVRQVLSLYTAYATEAVRSGELLGKTAKDYLPFLESAASTLGSHLVAKLEARHVHEWTSSKKAWGPTTRHKAITILGQALNWAKRFGYLEANPIVGIRKPARRRREAILTPEQADTLFVTIDCSRFRGLVEALRETGCRPGEIYDLTADRVDLAAGTWLVANKTRRATGEAFRTVYLSDAALALSRRLLERHAEGLVFRNRNGRKWVKSAVCRRFRALGRKLGYGAECVPYSFRHLYATDCLERGIAPATVAELLGHTDLTMVARVYSKLRQRTGHLSEAARLARRAS